MVHKAAAFSCEILLTRSLTVYMPTPPACRRYGGVEYVLDYIMERKRVDDLHQSIKDRRYDKQKYNMQRCGLRHLVYLVEGDPDALGDEVGRALPGLAPTYAHSKR